MFSFLYTFQTRLSIFHTHLNIFGTIQLLYLGSNGLDIWLRKLHVSPRMIMAGGIESKHKACVFVYYDVRSPMRVLEMSSGEDIILY